jgi:ubiquinone/menaquinone biosynthesis C-methylase UbiE
VAGSTAAVASPLSPERARSVYDRIGSAQDTQGFYERPAVEAMLAHAEPAVAKSVLEIGCGTGWLAEELLRDCLPGVATYLGLELSPRMVELAQGRVGPWTERAEVRPTDGSPQLPVDDGSIDLALSTYVFDLLGEGDTRALLASLERALSAEGRLGVVSLTAGDSGIPRLVSSLWAGIWRLRPELTGGCRPIELGGLLAEAGWSIGHRETIQAWGVSSEVVVASPPGR